MISKSIKKQSFYLRNNCAKKIYFNGDERKKN